MFAVVEAVKHDGVVFLDFDGVVNQFTGVEAPGSIRMNKGEFSVPAEVVDALREARNVVWCSWREEGVYDFTDAVGLPRFPYVPFDDTTSSKTTGIAQYLAHHCVPYGFLVVDDALDNVEVTGLVASGGNVWVTDPNTLQVTDKFPAFQPGV